jgi:hypothetical protein
MWGVTATLWENAKSFMLHSAAKHQLNWKCQSYVVRRKGTFAYGVAKIATAHIIGNMLTHRSSNACAKLNIIERLISFLKYINHTFEGTLALFDCLDIIRLNFLN